MKLMEIIADLDAMQDPMQFRDNEDANWSPMDKQAIDAERKPHTPKRNSNVGKAKRMVNRIKMHKRATNNPTSDETHHQSNIGGHVSSFLHR